MIAYAPGRRRTARSLVKKWSLLLFAAAALASVWVVSAVVVYNARPVAQQMTVVLAPPTATTVPYHPSGPDLSLPSMYAAPIELPQGPRAASSATVYLGPGENYLVLGTLQAGAPLEVVGRDESAVWLAVVFPPNSTFRAWLPVTQVLGIRNVRDLPVEPVSDLP